MKSLFITAMAAMLMVTNNPLCGRWQSKLSEKGNVTSVVFKDDSTFEGFINRKAFTSGVYHFNPEDSVFSFTDNGCNGVTGLYKIQFFSNSDSLTFRAISDSCVDRKKGMERLVFGRVKN
jgi:hypothetical protein